MRPGFVGMIVLLISRFIDVAFAEGIEDPRHACEALADVMAEADADKLAEAIVSDSRGGMRPTAEVAARQLVAFTSPRGSLGLKELMAERDYGEHYKRVWYLVVFEDGQPLFVLCDYMKPDSDWQLVNLKIESQFEDLPSP